MVGLSVSCVSQTVKEREERLEPNAFGLATGGDERARQRARGPHAAATAERKLSRREYEVQTAT